MKKTFGEWVAIVFLLAMSIAALIIFISDPQGFIDSAIEMATTTCWMGYGTPPHCIGW